MNKIIDFFGWLIIWLFFIGWFIAFIIASVKVVDGLVK
jgi:hypothetical protein